MNASENPTLNICGTCQTRFERNAAFTMEFFKERAFLKKTNEPDYYDTFYGSELHLKRSRIALLYFLVGLNLKQHLIGSFDRLAHDFNGRFIEENDYHLWAAFNPEHIETISAPVRTRIEGLNATECCILGYHFFLITDQRPLPAKSLIQQLEQEQDLTIMHAGIEKDIYEDFEAFMEEFNSRKK
ncbi:hypothetical protein B9G79_08925 [Bdellovibrio bacteriovorus]|uniref:Uncharacterized protein n=2 Tax=Bdellovibrio bacteriovorus TaxID=959 RepID=A0A1Z3N8B8_BDEBC|nr:hypothetical protein B9G79_08925 [Bdellovibrio bacteriovorus]